MADQELERVFITFLANDKDLEKNYQKIVNRAKQVATEVGREFQQATGKGMSGMSSSVEQDANRMEKALADVYRAITALTDGLAKTRGRQRETTKTTDETREAFLKLRNETAALRNTVEAGATSTAAAIVRFKELQEEALDASNAFARGSNEYRQFTQVAAQASRSIATLEGRTTKLGFSANAAVGITHALRLHVDFLGKNAGIAGNGFAALGVALRNFRPVGEGVQGIFEGIRRGLLSLQIAVPLATAAITAGLTVALVRVGKAAAETADQIDKASRSIGFTAEAFQEISFALEQSGVSIDQTRQGLQDMNARLGQAAGGAASIVNAYQQLGVAIRDSNGAVRDSEDVFMDLVDALSRVPSAAEKAALGGLVFGEEFSRRVIPALDEGREGFQALRDQAREMGLILTNEGVQSLVEFKDAWNVVTRQINTAKTEIVAAFMPVITRGLIPLLQDTLVPALQNVATRLGDMADAFFDAGEEGKVFRDQIATVGARIQGIGQFLYSLGQISVGLVQVLVAPFAALGTAIGNVSIGLEAMIDVYRRALQGDFSGFAKSPAQVMREAGVNMRDAIESFAEQARLGLSNLGTGGALFFGAFDFDALEAQWRSTLDGIVTGTREATRELSALTGVGTNGDAGPAGSLAALREELKKQREAFEKAGSDAGRAFHAAVIKELEAAIQDIEDRFKEDPTRDARAWTERLAAEMREGLKSAGDVLDLIQPRIDELRIEAAAALSEFGFDSSQYADTVAKLTVLEGLLKSIDVLADARAWTRRLQAEVEFGAKSAEQVVALIMPRILELREEAATALSDFGVDSTEFQTAQAKLELLEGLVERLAGKPKTLAIEVKADILPISVLANFPDFAMPEQEKNAIEGLVDAYRDGFLRVADAQAALNGVTESTRDVYQEALEVFEIALQSVEVGSTEYLVLADAIVAVRDRLKDLNEQLGVPLVFPDFALPHVEADAATAIVDAYLKNILRVADVQAQLNGVTTDTRDAYQEAADIFAAILPTLDEGTASWFAVAEALLLVKDRLKEVESQLATPLLFPDFALPPQDTSPVAAADAVVQAYTQNILKVADVQAELNGVTEQTRAAYQEAADVFEALLPTLAEGSDEWLAVASALVAVKGRLKEVNEELKRGPRADMVPVRVIRDLAAAQARLAELTGDAPSQWEELRKSFLLAAAAGQLTVAEFEELLRVLRELENADKAQKAMRELAAGIDIGTQIATGLTDALEGVRDGGLDGVLAGLTGIGTAIGMAIGGPAGAALAQSIGQAIQAIPALVQVISDLFTGDSPARRELAENLTDTIEGAVRNGIDAGLRNAEDWRESLRSGIRESVVGALVDAFIEAAVTQAIIAPFIDEFTRILHRQGRGVALDFLEANLNSILSAAEAAAAGIVRIFDRYFDDIEDPTRGVDPFNPGTFELPDATVSVLAAPQWALELTTAAGTISLAGEAMLEAATMMQATFQAGITVNNQSTRGIDAQRAAL